MVPIIARSGFGKEELLDACMRVTTEEKHWNPRDISYGEDLDTTLTELVAKIDQTSLLKDSYPSRYTAIKYLENDDQILSKGQKADPLTALALEEIVDKASAPYPENSRCLPRVHYRRSSLWLY